MTKSNLRAIIGENIRNERTARNISIDELSELIDLTPGFVGLIERGRRGTTPSTLYKLAEVFDIPIDDLFYTNSTHLASNQQPACTTDIQKKKIISFISIFDGKQLNFIIAIIRGMIGLKESLFEDNFEED